MCKHITRKKGSKLVEINSLAKSLRPLKRGGGRYRGDKGCIGSAHTQIHSSTFMSYTLYMYVYVCVYLCVKKRARGKLMLCVCVCLCVSVCVLFPEYPARFNPKDTTHTRHTIRGAHTSYSGVHTNTSYPGVHTQTSYSGVYTNFLFRGPNTSYLGVHTLPTQGTLTLPTHESKYIEGLY